MGGNTSRDVNTSSQEGLVPELFAEIITESAWEMKACSQIDEFVPTEGTFSISN